MDTDVIDVEYTSEVQPIELTDPKPKKRGPGTGAKSKKGRKMHSCVPSIPNNIGHTKKPGSIATSPFVPTKQQLEMVETCAKHGMSKAQVSVMVKDLNGDKLGYDCFKKYFDDVFAKGLAEALDKVGAALLDTALQERTGMHTVKAAEMFLKCKGAWRETETIEVVGPNGGPIEARIEHDVSDRVAELLTQIKSQKAIGADAGAGVDETGEG